MFNIKINNTIYSVTNPELTVLQQCEVNSIYIPRFCYHDRLSIAGNCRMCLIELETSVKPVIACSSSLVPNMSIFTNSKTVKKIRENILEFLLINHPLDCPICDQGGECDLQDQSMVFGSDRGRFVEAKRSVEDKNFGPYIKTIMTRCIHCTRCVRFFDEVAGFPVVGTMGRGRETEISMYFTRSMDSEISGNVIDLCPVGALTSKPYAFTSRPWELTSFETIDILDSLGSNMRVDVKGNSVMRILPKLNENINEEWISDKIRFSYESLRKDRLTFPLIKVITNSGVLFSYTSWDIIFMKLKYILSLNINYAFHIYGGEHNDLFSLFLLRYWIDACENFVNFYTDSMLNPNIQSSYLFNTPITSLSSFNSFLFSNVNLKKEVSVLNIRIRKLKWKMKDSVSISYVGPHINLNYSYKHLGVSQLVAISIVKGKHFICSSYLNSKLCVIQKNNNLSILSTTLSKNIMQVNTLKSNTSSIHYNALGFKSYSSNSTSLFNIYYLMNYHKLFQVNQDSMNYIIYHGTHGNWNSMVANLVLPCHAYMEHRGWYLNLEGRVQISDHIIYGPSACLPSVSILISIMEVPYNAKTLNIHYFKGLFTNMVGNIVTGNISFGGILFTKVTTNSMLFMKY